MRPIKFLGLALMILMSLCIQNSYAQDVQMATLQHGDELSAFYGADAFAEALEKAEDNDVINLSSGVFNGVTITKPVKIYGAGAVQDDSLNLSETKIQGIISVVINGAKGGLHLEGINCCYYLNFEKDYPINNAVVSKCKFNQINIYSSANNCLFEKCRVILGFNPGLNSQNLVLDNSIVSNISENLVSSTFLIRNCIIGRLAYANKNGDGGLSGATIKNSVIFGGGGDNTVQYSHCALTRELNSIVKQEHVVAVNNILSIFENLSFDVSQDPRYGAYVLPIDNDYVLNKDAIVENGIHSSDNTEIGIHGGTSPFTSIPSNPQIVSKEIAAETDEEGKLAVKIKVEAQNK